MGAILLAVGRLVGLTVGGYLLFKIPPLKKYVLPVLLFVTLNIIFPMYSVHNFPLGWDEAVAAGWPWMLGSFVACFVIMGLLFLLGRLCVSKFLLFPRDREKELLLMFGVQNAGYIPLPILASLTGGGVLVYMFLYIFAFNLIFWTIAVAAIAETEGKRFRFKLNMPLVGLLVGFLVAALDLETHFPAFVSLPLSWAGAVALDLILIVLGGILATIPAERFRVRREFVGFVGIKMVLVPALILPILMLVPMPGLPGPLASGIKLALLLQFVVPPATNIMIATRAYGTPDEVHYIGGGIITTYAAMVVTLPVFLLLGTTLF